MTLLNSIKRGKESNPPRLMVYGPEGSGKSTFGAGAPKPIFIQTEDGLGEIDCEKFPLAQSLDDVMKSIEALYTETHDYATVIVDSVDWLERLIWDRVCRDFPVKYNSIEKVDGGYGKGYVHALTHWREFLTALNGLRHEKQMAVILIGHSKIEKFEEPGMPAFDRFSPKLHKHAGAMLIEWCDAVLFACSETDVSTKERKRLLKAVAGQSFVAKNRYQLPDKLPLSWADLMDRMARS